MGVGKLYYADKWILVNRPAMLFSNPLVPYAWESISEEQKGMFCIFNEQFVQSEEKNSSLANSPLFKVTGDKVFFLDDTQITKVLDIYIPKCRKKTSQTMQTNMMFYVVIFICWYIQL